MIGFVVIGIDHSHIIGQTRLMLEAGAELLGYATWDNRTEHGDTPAAVTGFRENFPGAEYHPDYNALLDNPKAKLVVSTLRPTRRAALIEAAFSAGKDVMFDKPLAVNQAELDQLSALCARYGRRIAIDYSERVEFPAMVEAERLVKTGAIGAVVQTIGMGPHRANLAQRPDWFFDRNETGGILIDIGSHQIDHFLAFSEAKPDEVRVDFARVANTSNPEIGDFDDFGELLLSGENCRSYARVDWLTPESLESWGDGRFFVLGSEGYIEIRKTIDMASRPGQNHLFISNKKRTSYVDCQKLPLNYGKALCRDLIEGSETAMTQSHVFAVGQLAIDADNLARNPIHGTEANTVLDTNPTTKTIWRNQ